MKRHTRLLYCQQKGLFREIDVTAIAATTSSAPPPLLVGPAIRSARSPSFRDIAILCVVCVLVLAPFLNKAANIDDPLFLWTARQISVHPLDFYGFQANWDGHPQPMADVMINPPLVGYYLAGVAKLFGWQEMVLHAAMLPFAMLSVIGVYLLAIPYCRSPLLAALLMLLCPAFLVSATTLMCDVPLLCFWIWTIIFWLRGTARSPGWSVLAGMLLGLAMMTKYTAVCLLPLLLVYTLLRKAPIRNRVVQYAALLVPVAVIFFYNHYTWKLYGRPLFFDAIGYSTTAVTTNPIPTSSKLLDGVTFLGGGALIAAVLGFIAAKPRVHVAGIVCVPAMICLAWHCFLPRADWSNVWSICVQAGVLATAGFIILFVCVRELIRSQDISISDGIFLLLWIAGVFIFASKLNWAVNARSIMPLVPPVCIATERVLQRRVHRRPRTYMIAAGACTLVSLLVAVADYQFAEGGRWAVSQTLRQYPNQRVWFVGHWGFQYYMQLAGAIPLDDQNPRCQPWDIVVVATNNYGQIHAGVAMMPLDALRADTSAFLATQNTVMDAGFYFSPGNRLPFVFGNIPADKFAVFEVVGDGHVKGNWSR